MKLLLTVVTFNRLHSLSNLMESLKRTKPNSELIIDILISIDFSPEQKLVFEFANKFDWDLGVIDIIAHKNNIGLKNHIHFCGDYFAEKNNWDAILMLEDDLIVSDSIFLYLNAVYNFIKKDKNIESIAGIACYSPEINETDLCSFTPIVISDNYYAQLPCSWGQLWTKKMWLNYRNFNLDNTSIKMPANIERWSVNSWKKDFLKYMIISNKYFLYPTNSFTSNTGASGVHMQNNHKFQVNLSSRNSFNFTSLDTSPIYDSCLDLLPIYLKESCLNISDIDFNVNFSLDKSKNNQFDNWEVSFIKREQILKSWSSSLIPIENNLIYNSKGSDIFLSKGTYTYFNYLKGIFAKYKRNYFNRYYSLKSYLMRII